MSNQCTGAVNNSVCENGTNKCACFQGYAESNGQCFEGICFHKYNLIAECFLLKTKTDVQLVFFFLIWLCTVRQLQENCTADESCAFGTPNSRCNMSALMSTCVCSDGFVPVFQNQTLDIVTEKIFNRTIKLYRIMLLNEHAHSTKVNARMQRTWLHVTATILCVFNNLSSVSCGENFIYKL